MLTNARTSRCRHTPECFAPLLVRPIEGDTCLEVSKQCPCMAGGPGASPPTCGSGHYAHKSCAGTLSLELQAECHSEAEKPNIAAYKVWKRTGRGRQITRWQPASHSEGWVFEDCLTCLYPLVWESGARGSEAPLDGGWVLGESHVKSLRKEKLKRFLEGEKRSYSLPRKARSEEGPAFFQP